MSSSVFDKPVIQGWHAIENVYTRVNLSSFLAISIRSFLLISTGSFCAKEIAVTNKKIITFYVL